jgi:hypothetical protein
MGEEDTVVSLTIAGKQDAVEEINLLNAAGKKINQGWFSSDMGGRKTMGLMTEEPIDPSTTVQVILIIGQQTVTVPFELKDVKLP